MLSELKFVAGVQVSDQLASWDMGIIEAFLEQVF